ncbi:MAG: hypothetical protein VR74_15330 [Hyphomonas sp. BRH_c22]|nr:MAG: hypothetical protein VR74_15330 [Hyphomonas sp. BRH_c22]
MSMNQESDNMAPDAANVVSDELVEIRGLRFHYRDWPSKRAGAPSLVLLHGFTGHARSWDPFAEAMTDRYRVLSLDLRGHGETGWAGPGGYNIDAFVADIDCFAQAMKLESFSLVALSMGGLAAMVYAGQRPAALASCVLIDFGPEIDLAGIGRIQSNVHAPDTFATRDEAFAVARADSDRQPEAAHRLRSDAGLMRTEDGQWTYRYDRALRVPGELNLPNPETIWQTISHIEVPTLIVRGALSDILSPKVAQRMVETIPDARLETVAAAGHGVPYDAAEDFLAVTRNFLKG